MPIVAADWSIDRATGNIRYIGDGHTGASPSYATVLEFVRWLLDLADDPEFTGDDQVDMISTNPANRNTDKYITLYQPFNIDATAAEHLYGGSIVQNGGAERWDGIIVYGSPQGMNLQIIQNGSLISNDFWNSNGGLNADPANGVTHRFLIQTRTGGADIDGRRLIGLARNWGYDYKEFSINGTQYGENVLALSTQQDLNNQTPETTVAGWTTITNVEGYNLIDVDNDGTTEPFYSQWNRDVYSINDLYERTKYLSRTGSTDTLYGLPGGMFRGITHEIDVDTPTGTFQEPEQVSWSTGTGQLLAINSTTAPTKMWIQLLTGTAPTDNQTITGATSGATCLVNVNVVQRDVSTPFIGLSTGSAIIGAYGVGIEAADLSANDRLKGLDDVTYAPPNNVTFQVLGLVAGEDRVLVGPWDGTTTDLEGNPRIQLNQLSLQTALTGTAETAVVVTTAIPADTPTSGTIRVQTASGLYRLINYTSWSGSTFTIPATDFSGDNAAAGNDVFISYIDTLAASSGESFTVVYSADRQLVVQVRDGGASPIKPFITSATLTVNGGSVTAIRTSDA